MKNPEQSDLIMFLAMDELKKALRMKNMNQELLDHLNDSIDWLFRYSEKYGIILPERENLHKIQEKSQQMVDDIVDMASTESQHQEFQPKTQQNRI